MSTCCRESTSTEERGREKKLLLQTASKIQTLDSSIGRIACFETLCGIRHVAELLKIIPTLRKADEAKFIDKNCNWSCIQSTGHSGEHTVIT